MKGIILAFSHFDTGGLQTLMIRVAEWCGINGVAHLLIYGSIDSRIELLCENKNLKKIKAITKKEIKNSISSFCSEVDDIALITFELPEFMIFEDLRLRYFKNLKIRHFLYVVSVGGMIRGREISGWYGSVIKHFYKRISSKIYFNKQVFFMDDETSQATLDYYEIFDANFDDNVYLLPMFISGEPDYKLISGKRKIFTVTRAVFPYKGYVLGLLDDFQMLSEQYEDLELTIVSFGADIEKLRKKISNLNSECRVRIRLIEGGTLSEIKEELKDTYVYVGMGTTVLDAADKGVPVIVSWHSTNENICTSFFHKNPRVIGRDGTGIEGKILLNEILNYTNDEYLLVKKATYRSYRANYNIDNILPCILNRNTNNDFCINRVDICEHSILERVRNVRRKILQLK